MSASLDILCVWVCECVCECVCVNVCARAQEILQELERQGVADLEHLRVGVVSLASLRRCRMAFTRVKINHRGVVVGGRQFEQQSITELYRMYAHPHGLLSSCLAILDFR